jgi:glycosyltransferase involved in cell wall biosynthesis
VSDASPLVSVVIPCYNYGRFLGEAIESALTQSHRPLEVIVVDDGSNDDSAYVAARYPVRLLRQSHQGVCRAVNAGVKEANGEFIVRLDADDILSPTYVAETLSALERAPDASFAYTDGRFFGTINRPYRLQRFDADTLAETNYVPSLALVRTSAFVAMGGFNPEMGQLRCEDWDLWLTFAEYGLRGIYVPRTLWFYRRHARHSRNSWDFLSPAGILREARLVARLQERHQCLFAPTALARRLRSLPGRIANGQASVRHGLLLLGFYSVMFARHLLYHTPPRH